MTHSLSTFAADRPPAMYRSATLAIVVSSTSMNVGTTTAAATNQGLIAGRLTAAGARAALLMRGLLRPKEERRMIWRALLSHPLAFKGRWDLWEGGQPLARAPRGWARGLGGVGKWVVRRHQREVPWACPCSTRK